VSPECRSPWDFDAFRKDETGRVVSTKTPVAKMTAPISPTKLHTMVEQRASARRQKPPDANRSGHDAEITAAAEQQAGKLDENNSSNRASRLLAETATAAASLVKTSKVDLTGKSQRNSSSEKLKDDKVIGDSTRLANRLDENNSSNKAKMSTDVAYVFKTPRVDVAGKSLKNSSAEKRKNDRNTADNSRLVRRFDENNSSNKSKMTSRGSVVKDHRVRVGRVGESDQNNSSSRQSDYDKDDKYEEAEGDLNLPKAVDVDRSLRSLSFSTFQPDEKRRRSPSLQVMHIVLVVLSVFKLLFATIS